MEVGCLSWQQNLLPSPHQRGVPCLHTPCNLPPFLYACLLHLLCMCSTAFCHCVCVFVFILCLLLFAAACVHTFCGHLGERLCFGQDKDRQNKNRQLDSWLVPCCHELSACTRTHTFCTFTRLCGACVWHSPVLSEDRR